MSMGQGVLGYNMFAYCGNNPVNRRDATGHAWEDIEYMLKKAVDFVVQGTVFVFFPVTSTLGRQLHYNTPEDRGTFNVYSGENWVLNFTVHGGFDVVLYMIWR